jgi:hypothetical protein
MKFLAPLLALPLIAARSDPWAEEYGGTPDLSFSGITTFAHLPHERCLDNIDSKLDVAILGVPYDNAVSYRPGKLAVLIAGKANRKARDSDRMVFEAVPGVSDLNEVTPFNWVSIPIPTAQER